MVELVISDIDGVLTDSSINIGESGELFKSFDVKDGHGIVNWNERDGKAFVVVTARMSDAVEHRTAELGISEVYQGVDDKRERVAHIADQRDVSLNDTAYIGDDISDLGAMDLVGKACCPADAVLEVKQMCDYVSDRHGGDGAVRDILSHLGAESKPTVGVIPARYGSTRFPGKPLADIDGKPMIQHVYERATRASELDRVIVATDDERIQEAVTAVGGEAMMTEQDHETGTDRVAEVARQVQAEHVVNIQGDEPLIDPAVIDAVVRALQQHSPRVATPVTPIEDESVLDDPNTVKVVTDTRGRALYFSRSKIPSRGESGDVDKHIGLYGFETDFLLTYVSMESTLEGLEDLEQLRILENGYEIRTVRTDYDGPEINVESDIPLAEKKLHNEHDS